MIRALSLLLLVASCSGSVECEIDSTFAESQRKEIELAASAWNSFTARQVRIASNGEWLVLPARVPNDEDPSIPLHPYGLSQGHRRLVRIDPSTPSEQVYAVALHELGHVLGLKHVARGVMDPRHQTVRFSAEDIAECRRVGACE